MKNFNGTPLEINQIQGVDFLGYELIDKENGIRYELVNEPWVSLAAAAMSGGGKRKLTSDYKVIYSDNGYQAVDGKVVLYVPDWKTLPIVLDANSLYDLIYNVDYNGFELTIYFNEWLEDLVVDTQQLENCSKVNLVYLGKPFKNCHDLYAWAMTSAVGNWKNYTMTILNDTVPVEISGNVMVGPTGTDYPQFSGLFICKKANVNIKDFGLQINPANYNVTPKSSYAAWIYGEESNLTFTGKFFFYYSRGGSPMPSEDKLSRPASHVSIDKYSTMRMEEDTFFNFNGDVTDNGLKWVMHRPYFRIGNHCNAVIMPQCPIALDPENVVGSEDVDAVEFYVDGYFNKLIFGGGLHHLIAAIYNTGIPHVVDRSRNYVIIEGYTTKP